MTALASETRKPDEIPAQERIPLSGEALDVAIKSLETPNFLMHLTARIMKLARNKGFQSPFIDSMDSPGGKSAADLAGDIIEKALSGTYTWDRQQIPDFYHFCLSRAESILSNWLDRMRNFKSMSPMAQKDSETGEPVTNQLTSAAASDDLYAIFRLKDSGEMGDRFLQDLAFELPDGSAEQKIMMAVFDDRECANRAYCRGKLGLTESDYDAAVKRLLRKLPAFGKEWRAKNNVGSEEWREAQ